MERKVIRINGNPERLHNWTIEQLINGAGHLEDRLEQVTSELSAIYSEIERQKPEWFSENAINGDVVDEPSD